MFTDMRRVGHRGGPLDAWQTWNLRHWDGASAIMFHISNRTHCLGVLMIQKVAIALHCGIHNAGVMNSTVQGYSDFLDHEHTKAVGAVAYVEHDGAGTVPMPQIPGLPRIEGPSTMTHAPHIGEHSAVLLKEWGYGDDAISSMLSKKVTAVSK